VILTATANAISTAAASYLKVTKSNPTETTTETKAPQTETTTTVIHTTTSTVKATIGTQTEYLKNNESFDKSIKTRRLSRVSTAQYQSSKKLSESRFYERRTFMTRHQ
jgi:hypothetical protein